MYLQLMFILRNSKYIAKCCMCMCNYSKLQQKKLFNSYSGNCSSLFSALLLFLPDNLCIYIRTIDMGVLDTPQYLCYITLYLFVPKESEAKDLWRSPTRIGYLISGFPHHHITHALQHFIYSLEVVTTDILSHKNIFFSLLFKGPPYHLTNCFQPKIH